MTHGIEIKLGIKVMALGWDLISANESHRKDWEQECINSNWEACQ